MSIVIDANMKLFADRMNITSSRMIQDYGLKTVDEIIESEASKGNTQAVKYAQEMYNSPAKLIQIFRLTDVENKFVILHNMDSKTREEVLPMLDKEDLAMGLYFFTQDKLLDILANVDIEELVGVILNAFPLEDIINMFQEEDLAMFFHNDKLEKNDIMNELKSLPPDVMIKFIEGLTGKPYFQSNPEEILKNIEKLPEDKFRDFVSMIDPDIQKQLTFQLTKKDPEKLQLFNQYTYVKMLSILPKPEMVKPMIALEKDTILNIITLLPDDLMAIVASQIDTTDFAEFLLKGHTDILEQALMI